MTKKTNEPVRHHVRMLTDYNRLKRWRVGCGGEIVCALEEMVGSGNPDASAERADSTRRSDAP